jgi:CHAD domain-containing protein
LTDAELIAGAEVEWQLEAQDLRVVQRWLATAAANANGGVAIGQAQTETYVDTYVDTADRRLDRAGFSVRLRRSGRRVPEVTLESLAPPGTDALRARLELTERIDEGDPTAIALVQGPVGARVRALVGKGELVPLFDIHTRRRTFPLSVAGTPGGELLLDETTVRDPDGKILGRLRRVDVEVPESAVGGVRPLVETLRRACGLQPAMLSKYEAALVASGSARAEREDFGPTAIEPGDTIGQVGLALLRRQFATLLAKEPGTRLGDDVEELHDMRVASRRLRAALSLLADDLPVEASRLRPELAWLGQTVGAVRDLDVQLVRLDEWLALVPEPERVALDRLRAILEDERTAARRAMLDALDSARYERLVRRFGAMLRGRTGARTRPALAAAPDLVARRHRGVRKAMRRIGDGADPSAYHRLRIATKRLRYSLEFLSDVYPGETKRLVARTVALQDLLGEYQDGEVAISRLRELARDRSAELGPEAVFAMGEIAERYRAAMLEAKRRVPAAYAGLEGKDWKRLRRRLEAEDRSLQA